MKITDAFKVKSLILKKYKIVGHIGNKYFKDVKNGK
jgi:hypothetical protein